MKLRASLIYISILLITSSFTRVEAAPNPYVYSFYNPALVQQQCSNTTLSGSENSEKIYNYFIGKGLTPVQAAGIMGNIQAESGFEPRLVEYGFPNSRGEISRPGDPSSLDDNIPPNAKPNGQPGYGLAQWTSPNRKDGLRNLAAQAGTKHSDLGTQLDYLWQELEGPYKSSTLDPIRASNDIRTITSIFMIKFENPRDKSPSAQAKRAEMSIAHLEKYGSNGTTATSDSGSTTCNSNSNQAIDGLSLPVEKKWYDQQKEWFTKPHHSYPAADIPVPTGTPIYAMMEGKIIKAPTYGSCGIGLIIDSPGGIRMLYCHGSDGGSVPGAKNGDTVTAGQLIMHSASTGHSTGPHLHLELRVNGTKVCPQSLFVGIAEGAAPPISSLPSSGCVKGKRPAI